MTRFISMLLPYKFFIAGVTALAMVMPVAAATTAHDGHGQTAVVRRVVDGDTIDVDYDRTIHRVRLLNVDTPETVDPQKPVQCLGPEATAFLRGRLPEGTSVRLRFDRDRFDPYTRELAGVFVGGSLVNADIARAGLGVAVLYEPNERFYAQVLEAQREAERHQAGLYSRDVECTLPAKMERLEQAVDALATSVPQSGADLGVLDRQATGLAAALAHSSSLATLVREPTTEFVRLTYPSVLLQSWIRKLESIRTRVAHAASQVARVREREAARVKAVRSAAEKAAHTAAAETARRKAAKARDKRAAEKAASQAAKRSAARIAREVSTRAANKVRAAQRRASGAAHKRAARASERRASHEAAQRRARNAARHAAKRSTTHRSPSSTRSARRHSYTGCRAYGPHGTSRDSRGRPYTKISC